MNKTAKYELLYIKFTWALIFVCAIYIILSNAMGVLERQAESDIYINITYFALVATLNYAKLIFLRKGLFEKNEVYMASRIIELFLIAFSIIFMQVGYWLFIFLVFPVFFTSISKGSKPGLLLIGSSFIVYALLKVVNIAFFPYQGPDVYGFNIYDTVFYVVFFYLSMIIFTVFCGYMYKENIEREHDNKKLLDELEEKYDQIAIAQEEAKCQYERLKDANIKLEDTNKKLTSNIAEFYTLQQISQAIGSIFDIKELLKYVNDIIIGVMGVNNSTIILYDEKKKILKVDTTNIKNEDELLAINDNINSKVLVDVLDKGKPIIENFVDHEEYAFTKGRDVNSLICIPLNTKSRKQGLVLIEHKYYNAFDEENVRLLDIIAQQVGIAMENAELYQQMQELATTDGLTGVYNRVYFHDRLQKEYKSAKEGNYELSLAIFDIDHFKKFNDTYGHLFGDKVLKSIAELVKSSLRNSDIFARFGGEEFIILFPRTSLQDAYEKVEALRQKIAQSEVKDNLVTANVTVSFGIACFPLSSSLETELIRDADDALYDAKKNGRNCVRVAKTQQDSI
ncbi:MAG: diguanylate cyclase [Clostridia bacterium]|nr:diguanylate cyclase [Clostridia bacterium]